MSHFDVDNVQLTDVEVVENTLSKDQQSQPATPEMQGHGVQYSFDVKMDIAKKYVRIFFTIQIFSTDQSGKPGDLLAKVTTAHGFTVSNLHQLASDRNGKRSADPDMLYFLFTLVYERSCGMIAGLAQHTSLQDFVMPVMQGDEMARLVSRGINPSYN